MKIDLRQITRPAAELSGRKQVKSEGGGNIFFELLRTNEQAFTGKESVKEAVKEQAKEVVADKENAGATVEPDSENMESMLAGAAFTMTLNQLVDNQVQTEAWPGEEVEPAEMVAETEPVVLTTAGDVTAAIDTVEDQGQLADVVVQGEAVEEMQPTGSKSEPVRTDTDDEPQETESTEAVTTFKTAAVDVPVSTGEEIVDDPVYTSNPIQQELPVEETNLAAAAQQTHVQQAEPEVKPETESGAEAGLLMNTALVGDQQGIAPQAEFVQVKSTPETLPADIGNTIAANLPEQDGALTIELEPASLGKLTIQVIYEEGRAAVSIMSSNPKTLEILSQQAGEIARILEDKTGQQTVIYTAPPQHQTDEEQHGQGQREQNQHQEQKQNGSLYQETFAQQLRLGLV